MAGPLRVVYITYDGLQDPLGQSQVVPYILGLSRRGHRFEIISFEKPGVATRWREPFADGVRWTALRYHRTPTVPATLWDMTRGAGSTALYTLFGRADLIHTRSYVPATLALPWAVMGRVPMLFDTRGFWPDEKVDGAVWQRGDAKYRVAKRVERMLLRRARAITVITLAAQRYLRREYPYAAEIAAPIHVIPCGVDLERFSPDVEPDPTLAPRLAGARVLCYVGSLGTYYTGAAIARFYLKWRAAVRQQSGGQSSTRLLVVTKNSTEELEEVLRPAEADAELVTHGVPHDRVASAIRWAEAGVSLLQPLFSKQATGPVKLTELLACGVPVATTVFGDIPTVLAGSPAGVFIRETSDEGLEAAARQLVEVARQADVRAAARAVATHWFNLDAAVDAYDDVYAGTVSRAGGVAVPDSEWPR